jgi:hypothetical protein
VIAEVPVNLKSLDFIQGVRHLVLESFLPAPSVSGRICLAQVFIGTFVNLGLTEHADKVSFIIPNPFVKEIAGRFSC